jgi:hypothetical protein
MNHSKILTLRLIPREGQYGAGGDGTRFSGALYQKGYGGARFSGALYQKGYGGGILGSRFVGRDHQRGYGCCVIRTRFHQKGKGWGAVVKWLARAGPALMNTFKSAAPHVLDGAKNFGREMASAAASSALNTGMQFMDDVVGGENVLESARARFKQGGHEILNAAKAKGLEETFNLAKGLKRKMDEKLQSIQSGSGGRRRLAKRRKIGGRGSGRARGRGHTRSSGRRGQRGGTIPVLTPLMTQYALKKLLPKYFARKSQSGKGLSTYRSRRGVHSTIRESVGKARGRVFGKRSILPYKTIYD